MEKYDPIYHLALHQSYTSYEGGSVSWEILRVHGGWLYTTGHNNGTNTNLVSVFVPYPDEGKND